MNKKLENNIDNIHPDILEVHQIELEDLSEQELKQK